MKSKFLYLILILTILISGCESDSSGPGENQINTPTVVFPANNTEDIGLSGIVLE